MLIETLRTLFNRDLSKLISEVEQYKKESNIWLKTESIPNSAGNLCLHLVGNLNAYIGAALGNSGYIRNRDQEFSLQDVPREQLLQALKDTRSVVDDVLTGMTMEQLAQTFPIKVFADTTTTSYMLVHLASHLSYHLGQVNYHRRLLDT